MTKIVWLLPFLLIALAVAQKQNTSIQLDHVYDINLKANTHHTFVLILPDELSPENNLYISAYSLMNDTP